MEDKKDILEAISGTTRNQVAEAGVIENSVLTSRYYCDALNDESINNVLGGTESRLITLVGFSEVGKSSFVASLYHKFMANGEVNGSKIVDSDTFVGFEKRAYVRNEAFKTIKRNARTTMPEGQFLTLTLSKNGKKKKLIVSDNAGEKYKNTYVDNQAEVNKDKGLVNTRHIIFFIDCSVLNDDDEYMDFYDKFQLLLSRMSTAGVFDVQKTYDIIYNKVDTNDTEEKKETYKTNRFNFENKLATEFNIKISNTFETISNDMKDDGMARTFDYIVGLLEEVSSINRHSDVNWVQTLLKEK
ncbi:TRAFAC clade GTPase domain-containing protein [Bacteroides xylanisolvens]|uniref:TRAFAC clade GTPase domain-containing protein n=1 Tax=Bacteroides xylanisolvens TaxID=371601 RepID=UPI0022E88068|nr:GTPase [Bacteroides xylanisolvens]